MKIGDAKVDFKALLIDGPDGPKSMEPKIMKLLQVLVDHAGQVMSREELITAVWGVEFGGDERLSRGISILRKALGDKRGQHTHIVTISRTGYRLIAEVVDDGSKVALNGASNEPAAVTRQGVQEFPIVERELERDRSTLKEKPKPAFWLPKSFAMIAGVLFAGLLIGTVILSGTRSGETLSLQAKLDRGYSNVSNYLPNGSITEAQEIFESILSNDPEHAAARAGLAFSLIREFTHLEKDPATLQRAIGHAAASLRSDEHLALANIAVAWGAEYEGDYEKAFKYLDRADILESDNILSLESKFRILRSQGELERAKDVINSLITIYPDQAQPRAARGNLNARMGDLAASEIDLRKAIELSPDSPRIYAQLGHVLHLQDKTNEAVDTIQQGLRINDSALLYNNLGTLLFFQGQYDLAASAFEKTIDLRGDTHDYLYWANLGDAYRWSKDKKEEAATAYKRALQLLQDSLDRNPDDSNLKSRAALFNAKLGELDKAQFYMDSFELASTSPSIQLYRAVVTYEIMSNRTKALESLDWAIKANYPFTEILNDPELAQLRQDPAYHRLLAKNQK